MTYIRVDPDELSAASTTLRSCASEAASIGHACASIGSAPSSPAVAGLFQQMEGLLRTADQAVQRVSGQFAALAGELLKRASTAATDAATAGTVAVTGAGIPNLNWRWNDKGVTEAFDASGTHWWFNVDGDLMRQGWELRADGWAPKSELMRRGAGYGTGPNKRVHFTNLSGHPGGTSRSRGSSGVFNPDLAKVLNGTNDVLNNDIRRTLAPDQETFIRERGRFPDNPAELEKFRGLDKLPKISFT